MFEIKYTESKEQLMIGTFVDVYEFADRWNKFSTFQRAVLKSNQYVGTLDDFALNVGYSAPMATLYRKQLQELIDLALIHVTDYNEEFYQKFKDTFDNYDFEQRKDRYYLKAVKFFFIGTPSDIANRILNLKSEDLPDHTCSNRSIVRKNTDGRKALNQKQRERYVPSPNGRIKKLSDEIKANIIKERNEGISCQKLAVKYNVTRQAIYDVLRG